VVSHKTQFANYGETRTDLRSAALSWMEEHRWLHGRGHHLSRGDVYFESSRPEKLERIQRLECTHFIDDLEETFLEERFPSGVVKVLYAPYPAAMASSPPGVTVASSWDDIGDRILGGTR
jgi:hypothetical protein